MINAMNLTIDQLMNLAVADPINLFHDEDKIIATSDGQLVRLISDSSLFCSLDHIEELSAEYGDPYQLCANLEQELGHPLAFDRYYGH